MPVEGSGQLGQGQAAVFDLHQGHLLPGEQGGQVFNHQGSCTLLENPGDKGMAVVAITLDGHK